MKTRKTILCFLLLPVFLLAACTDEIEDRIRTLKNDIATIEERLAGFTEELNSLSSLIEALEKNDHIAEIRDYSFLGHSGYQILFSSGASVLLRNGSNGVSPILGVRYDEDTDAYYWTVQMGPDGSPSWMTNSYGMRVRASGTVPRIKIEEGVWWYSFDGTSWSKCNWGPTQGASGASVFSSIDTSDPYCVKFTLADGTVFQMPTQQAITELDQQCDQLNQDFETYKKLMPGSDSAIFVKYAVAFEEGGVSGYRIFFEDGHEISVRSGRSSEDSVLLSAKAYTDGKYYWVFKNRSKDAYQWLRHDGKMICVTLEDVTPEIGITQVNGHLYFTVAYKGVAAELIRDENGNPIEATGKLVPDFFTAADVSDPTRVVLTMTDGTKVTLPRCRAYTPTVSLSLRSDYVEAATSYTYQLMVRLRDTLIQAAPSTDFDGYQKESGLTVEAIALDDGYAEKATVVLFSAKVLEKPEGRVAYDISFDIPFTTGSLDSWVLDQPSRYAIFISWMNKTIMKVAQFDRKVAVSTLSVSPATLSLAVGGTATLTAAYGPVYTTDTLSWSSSDTKVATVSDKGVVTAVAAGTCTITATMGKKTANCKVTVK